MPAMVVTWQDALDFIYRRANWEAVPAGPQSAFKLDRVRAVLADLGDPQQDWPAVHVAGTNGKGSTAALIAAGLGAAGYRVGLYTSPHLHTVRERVQVDGAPISEAAVRAWLNEHGALLEAHDGLTTFETLTALAFHYFAVRAVDMAVVEVGLGGRLDTTNVVEPALSVITPIDLDHMAVLGDTIAAIAADKAGIIRPGVPVVTAPQAAAAGAVLAAAAAAAGSRLVDVARVAHWTAPEPLPTGQRFTVTVDHDKVAQDYPVRVGLAGAYQVVNVATAVTALDVLARRGWQVGPEAVAGGFALARWPARFEILGADPFLVVDAAHNPHGARALATALTDRWPGARRLWVLGLSRDKDVDGILAALLPGARCVFAARADHPRAMAADEVADRVVGHGVPATSCRSPGAALDAALATAGPGDVVVAAGSVFLAADVREAWAARGHMPMPPRDPPASLATALAR
jgi:dihydrofolate synthase / folylpolyglutamate synthase